MTTPKLSKAATTALRAAADGTLGRNNSGAVTLRLGGAIVQERHVQQLTDCGYITDGRTTTHRKLYAATADGLAHLTQADGHTDTTCAGCGWSATSPNYRPGRTPGMCADCAPAHVVHYILAGDYATYCGKPRRDITTDPAQECTDADVDSRVNCTDCLTAKQRRH